jgi:hypothetical protein
VNDRDRDPVNAPADPPGDPSLQDATTEDMSAVDQALEDDTGDLGASLRALLEPPGDIRRRTADVVGRELRGRSAMDLGLDLLGLGWWTVRTILTDDPTPADGEDEGNDDEE